MYETFEEWYDVFTDECQRLGYRGCFFEETFMEAYENEKCPYEEAEEFVKFQNEQ